MSTLRGFAEQGKQTLIKEWGKGSGGERKVDCLESGEANPFLLSELH